ncbi:hypothetical protein [Leuconostoc citreum]
MTETVVHVTTLEEWKSVLDVWFAQGYEWRGSGKDYEKHLFYTFGASFLLLDDDITAEDLNNDKPFIEYKDFISQQEKTMAKETYYVTQEQLHLIKELKENPAPLDWVILDWDTKYRALRVDITAEKSNAVLRYLGGDETIEFKVKEQLYRLWRIDDDKNRVYMKLWFGTPTWTGDTDYAFTAPREEIEKHKTVSWEIEKVD